MPDEEARGVEDEEEKEREEEDNDRWDERACNVKSELCRSLIM